MEQWRTLVMGAAAIAGAWASARMEAKQIAADKPILHPLLACLRAMMAMMVIGIMSERESMSLMEVAWTLTLMAGLFGPTHRTALNLIRIHKYGHRIPWCHLGKNVIDRLAMMLTNGNEKISFLLLCVIEALVAGAAYNQLT